MTVAATPPARPVSTMIRGTIAKYCLLACTLVTGILLMPFTLHHLGPARYGLWMLVVTMTGYLQLLDAGYANGLVRHLVEAEAHQDTARLNRLINTFFCVYAVIGVLAGTVGMALAWLVVPRFPSLTPDEVRTGQWLTAILAGRVAIGFPMTVFGAVSFARQGFTRNTIIAVAVSLLNAAATWLVLSRGGGLLLLVATTTAINLLSYVAYAGTARQLCPEMRIDPRLFDRGEWRQVTIFSAYLFVIDVAVQVGFNLDNIVIGATLGTTAVGVYAVALRLTEYQRRVCDQFSDIVFAHASSVHDRGDREGLRATFLESTRIAVLLGAGAALGLIAFGRPLVHVWMGPGLEASIPALMALACATTVVVSHAPLANVLMASGSHRRVAAVWVTESAANLCLSLLWVRQYGLTGVALGTAIPVVIGHLGVLFPTVCRTVGVSLGTALRETALPAALAVAPAALLAAWLSTTQIHDGGGALALRALSVALVYALSVVFVGLTPERRGVYLTHLRDAIRLRLSTT